MVFLVLKAFSMGAGTFTGIEAVSNGLPILREPRVRTGKRTMLYMAASLSFVAFGLMVAYLLFRIEPSGAKTFNAILFERLAAGHGGWGSALVMLTLVSEGALLLVAAQAGFLDGPRVLSNMALDRWVPSRFAHLSDRLVSQNGILLMAAASCAMLALSGGNVGLLMVFYSINVFITFTLSQLGMVRHWISTWKSGARPFSLLVSGSGFLVAAAILCFVVYEKFFSGGWITLVCTLALASGALLVRRHYAGVHQALGRLDSLVRAAEAQATESKPPRPLDPKERTAVLLVNGWNGLGLHSLFSLLRQYGDFYRNIVILHVGLVDAGSFRPEEMGALEDSSRSHTDRYVTYLRRCGWSAQGRWSIGSDLVDSLEELALKTASEFPRSTFFGGQLVFKQDGLLARLLHNGVVFSLQRRLYLRGLPFMVLPVRVL